MHTKSNKPKFITFTGADDQTSVGEMFELSRLYPIEWGILFSPKKQGQGRYPSVDWMRHLTETSGLDLSAHLCGGHARNVMELGASQFDEPIRQHFNRAQINTASAFDPDALAAWGEWVGVRVIAQCRKTFPDQDCVAWLFDASGGRGIEPSSWPSPGASDLLRGYAGGLNPSNVQAAIAQISAMSSNYWIDMETGVRDEQDRFDLDRCRAVCEAVYGKALVPA